MINLDIDSYQYYTLIDNSYSILIQTENKGFEPLRQLPDLTI